MKKIFLVVPILLASLCYGREGHVVLKNGHTLCGDISVFPDGKIRVYRNGGSVYFNKSEVSSFAYDGAASEDAADDNKIFLKALEKTPPYTISKGNNTYDHLIQKASQKVAVDSALIKAVIEVESGFDPRGISCKGAQGLMQLMPGTSSSLGVKNPLDPKENIFGGSRYLRDMLALFNGDLRLALAAYNAGPEAVKKYKRIPPYRETQQYVQKVLSSYSNHREKPLYYEYVDPHGCLYLSNYLKDHKYRPIK